MNEHDFKLGDLVYVNGLPAVVYYVSPLQMRVLMLKRGDLKTYRINRVVFIKESNKYLEIDSIMNFLHEIGEQKK